MPFDGIDNDNKAQGNLQFFVAFYCRRKEVRGLNKIMILNGP